MQAPNKNYRDDTSKRLAGWLLLAFLWVLILSVWKGYVQTRRGFLRLEETADRLDKVKSENLELKDKLDEVNSEDYKIRIVREKLRLQKRDEIVVVMPADTNVIRLNTEEVEKPVWTRWLELII